LAAIIPSVCTGTFFNAVLKLSPLTALLALRTIRFGFRRRRRLEGFRRGARRLVVFLLFLVAILAPFRLAEIPARLVLRTGLFLAVRFFAAAFFLRRVFALRRGFNNNISLIP
jgi:hypothetical protein